MRKLKVISGVFVTVLLTLTVVSCKEAKKESTIEKNANTEMHNAKDEHEEHSSSEMNNKDMESSGDMSNMGQDTSKVALIINNYLELKDALVADNEKEASKTGNELAISLKGFSIDEFNEAQQKELGEIIESAVEHAEHIAKSHMDHQREHFKGMSIDIKDMIAITGTPNTIYQMHCPMYDKGSIWLSASNEVENPFYGSKMLKCGKVQKEIN